MRAPHQRPIVIAAGGTGGHFFPAEALCAELVERGERVILMTDKRSARRDLGLFEDRLVISGAGLAGRGLRAIGALASLARGVLEARAALKRLNARAVVGFGGYPAFAPAMAARFAGLPVILHEQNAVLGRANRFLSTRATALALSFTETSRVPRGVTTVVTGNPVRPGIGHTPYAAPTDTLRVLVLGGSLGARVMSDIVPEALIGLRGPPLSVVQQCREEDLDRVRAAYDLTGINAELARFFTDMPARLAAAHLVIARAGASTVSELAIAGKPAILIPLPHAIDDHQSANARALGVPVLAEPVTPAVLRQTIETLLPRLAEEATRIARHANPGAAGRLADLVGTYAASEVTG
jgi:UDP-N-acetylglucosamine--N-acetylmuramyl-(pentapeptide) pyrophosphoryl-undecaprenol N-acetylglucosamine transferase